MTTAVNASSATDPYAVLQQSGSSTSKSSDTASADRFLTMLVTQLQNQDPLNPMDNAQITSQMAQINTVTGLEKVNTSIQSLSSQFLQLQALQGAALVGHDVTLEGDRLAVTSGVGRGAVELANGATAVKVEVLDSAQQVVGSVNLGPQDAGRKNFEWSLGKLPADGSYTFRVTASNSGQAVSARTLMLDRVQSVSNSGDTLNLTLAKNGTVPASQVIAFN
jgi:flagellar basal-body rod modification protein FlgD